MPIKSNTCDFFICNAVLEHLPDDMKCIREIGRISKLNNKGCIVVPLKLKYVWPFFWLINYLHDKNIGHLRRYDYEDLKNRFGKVNFKITRVFYTGHLVKTIGVIFSMLFKIHHWNEKFEEWDNKKVSKKYGANNISICLKKESLTDESSNSMWRSGYTN